MAISPLAKYPGQINNSDPTGYPYGAAQNIVTPGDGIGTPWEKDLVNDIFGFQQALLDAAGITPTGTPDKVGASQYLDALEEIIDNHAFSNLSVTGNGVFGGDITCDDLNVGNIIATDDCTFSGEVFFNNDVTLGNGVDDTILVRGTATFQQQATFLNGLLMPSTLALSGIMTMTGGATVLVDPGVTFLMGSALRFTGAGHPRERLTTAPNADTSFGIADADVIYINAGTSRTYTLLDDDASDGDKITVVVSGSTSHTISGLAGADQTVAAGSSGDQRAVQFYFKTSVGWLVGPNALIP